MRSKKIFLDGYALDSEQEAMFYYWCLEAKKVGLIKDFQMQVNFQYANAVSMESPHVNGKVYGPKGSKRKELFSSLRYTADFVIILGSNLFLEKYPYIPVNSRIGLVVNWNKIYIEIKPPAESIIRVKSRDKIFSYDNRLKRDTFFAKRRMIFLTGVYINEVVVETWFKYTWVPQRLMYSDWNPWVPRKTAPRGTLRKKQNGDPFWHGYPLSPLIESPPPVPKEFPEVIDGL